MNIVLSLIALGIGVILHEYMHGWTADKFGDSTARLAGRLTLNPIAHIDLVGSIILPIFFLMTGLPGFGWAKPVPVNFGALRNPKRDMIWVGLAGPATNIVIATIGSVVLRIGFVNPASILETFLIDLVVINLILAIFNMVPIPPLDGSRIVMGLLPDRLAYEYGKLERVGFIILIFLLYMGMFTKILGPVVNSITQIFLGHSYM